MVIGNILCLSLAVEPFVRRYGLDINLSSGGVDDANINDDHDIDSVMVFLASLALTTCIIW